MYTRRDVALGLMTVLPAIALATDIASAGEAVPDSEALAAMNPWADALFSGDPAKVAKVLAPEYQILRSNGVAHDKESYLTALPKQAMRSQFLDIHATRHENVMVIRYRIETNQTIDGVPVVGISPRLSVFRLDDETWLISAHANFAPLE